MIQPNSLLVALPKSEIQSANGAVEMMMFSDIGKRGPYPVLESAAEILPSGGADLSVRLDRGIIVLTNLKKAGSASVKLTLRDKVWDLTLVVPETKVGIELFSRHKPGMHPLIEGKIPDPVTSVWLIVVKGKAILENGSISYGLNAPPGPAQADWSSLTNQIQIKNLNELPPAAKPPTEEELKMFKQICTCAEHLATKEAGPVLDAFLKSDQHLDRIIGVTAAGALDDLPRVFQALADPKHADERDHAVLVLRNWMGRQPGQVLHLFKELTVGQKYSPIQARTVLQLLFGPKDEEKFQPGTYDLLIGYLDHSKVAVRELARWHLVRLVPEGKGIQFDASAPEADRQKAIQEWRVLIPEGKLPQPKASSGK